jgi:hypothetical protein
VRPVQELDLIVALDYGQFYLSGSPTDDGVTDALVRLVEEAATGEGIAGSEGNEFVVVISPHQNNFASGFGSRSGPPSHQTTCTTGRRRSSPAS